MIHDVEHAIRDAYRKHGRIREIVVTCRDDNCTLFKLSDHDEFVPAHYRDNARAIGLHIMFSVTSHRTETGNLNYDIAIEPATVVEEIDVTITVNG